MKRATSYLILSIGAVACDGDSDAGTASDTAAETSPDSDTTTAVDAPAEALTVSHTLTPRDFVNNEVVVGLEVCAVSVSDQPCALTTQDGATFETPANEPALFVVRSPEYLDTLYPVPASPRDQVYSFPVFANGLADAAAAILGTSLDPERSHLLVFVSLTGRTGSPTVAGATVAFDVLGEGPFYIGDNNLPDPKLTLTTGAGTGIALNLEGTADEVIVDVTHPDRECVLHGPGLPIVDNDRTSARAPLRPAHLTHVQFRCPDP